MKIPASYSSCCKVAHMRKGELFGAVFSPHLIFDQLAFFDLCPNSGMSLALWLHELGLLFPQGEGVQGEKRLTHMTCI